MAEVISQFVGSRRFLSNFYPAAVDWEGIIYPSSEHAFNAGKTLDPARRQWIAQASSPALAKARGRSVELRPRWDTTVRYHVMEQVLAIKFDEPGLRRLLLDTADLILVEGNTWHDTHWGVCECPQHGYGDNHLGLMLMDLRARLNRMNGERR